jgi:hypothetical protein
MWMKKMNKIISAFKVRITTKVLWACVIQWPTGRGFTMKYGPGQKTTLEFT